MTKPTSPIAQRAIKEASRRRTSASFSTTTTSPGIKNLTFPVVKNRGLSKVIPESVKNNPLPITINP